MESCLACRHPDLIRVHIPEITKPTEDAAGQKKLVSSGDCPFCNSSNGLSILGAQAASLTSAMIGTLYTTPFNRDKKLLTFSDSVQDAAHRAGFYGARTYRTTLRTAIAHTVYSIKRPSQSWASRTSDCGQGGTKTTCSRSYWDKMRLPCT
ncbi:MAG: hypothetical protein KME45_09710 [Stenomitos rutilans HA7619-LM2]|nr:hypothetical protein [Stenomitos rutilans HA7619-LM2]